METEIKDGEEAGAGSEGKVKKQGWAARRQGSLRRGQEQVQNTAGCPRPSWSERAAAQGSHARGDISEGCRMAWNTQGDP